MFSAVLVVLVCACLLAESYVVKKDTCDDVIQCLTPIMKFLRDPKTTFAAIDGYDLDAFCEALSDHVQCVAKLRSGCDQEIVSREADGFINGAFYVCTSEGREAFSFLSESKCANNEWKQVEASEQLQDCEDSFNSYTEGAVFAADSEGRNFNIVEMCPYAARWVRCLTASARYECGDEYADFLFDVLSNGVIPQFAEMGCTETHSIVK